MTHFSNNIDMATLDANAIPWEKLSGWGIQRSSLENNKEAMERLLAGRFTPPLTFYRKDDNIHVEGQAALRCYKGSDGTIKLEMQGIGEKITENSKLYLFGVELSKEQVKNLVEVGHAGSLVSSKDGDKQFFVSLNKETNRLVSFPAANVTGPKDGIVAGVKMSQEQMADYLAGKPIYLRNMTRTDGSKFDACVQFSAWTRKNDFTHPEWLKAAQKAEKEAKEKLAEAVKEAPEKEQSTKKGRGVR